MLSSVEYIPEINAKAVFTVDSSKVFREDVDIVPVTLTDGTQYVPWGGDNMMPYHIIDLIERDETLATCQMFNAEVCYASGLQYKTSLCTKQIQNEVDEFLLNSSLPSYFLGVCQDFKHFGWCVSVIILDKEGKRIVSLHRKEVCYCRFSPANKQGRIEYVLYANWKKSIASLSEIEKIDLLNPDAPWLDLQERISKKTKTRKFAVVCRVPTPDSTYYPIPYYAALFRGKWYNIKQLIATAKESKLKNSAPLKYHIEVSQKYWDGIFKRERITDPKKMQERVVEGGKTYHHRLLDGCRELRQGSLLHILHIPERRGVARCQNLTHRRREGGRRLVHRHSGGGQHGMLHHACPLQPRGVCAWQVTV